MDIHKVLNLPNVIYTTSSPYNKEIEVLEHESTRKLRVNGASQSVNWESPLCEKLFWGKTVELLKKETPELKKILILGLGGGTVQHLVSRAFPEVYIVSVEIDSVIVDIAKKYFDTSSIPNHQIIVNDAFRVVMEPEEFKLSKGGFEAVFVDVYVGEQYPNLGKSGGFISAVKNMVQPGGLVIFNRIYTEEYLDDVDAFIEQLGEFLENIQTEIVAGYTNSDNILIYGRVF
ncbi:hypothetical protein A3K42_00225 [candidate division WWE3 bacterium RBG_13_37_7]|uniref:PABS domain-containing protein n=1 Tax=candidate division WWE3 bacterium RBG_13_37_7 TaxID=1802609 RepID=A0A1F4U0A8_UNCKA|nr:MAG: hypothetical protein A3K42_00225 [candidate division WWE3 bacterium RBG_13_37_7]